MSRQGLRRIGFVLGGLVLALAVAAAALGVRLAHGPIAINGAAPLIEDALSGLHPALHTKIGGVILRWDGWERGIDLRMTNVRLRTADGTPVVAVPELALTISSESLRRRRLLIEGVEVFRPQLRLIRDAEGRFALVIADAGEPAAQPVPFALADLAQPPDPATPLSYLQRIAVYDAAVSVVDEAGETLSGLRLASGLLARDDDGLRLRADLAVGAEPSAAHLDVDARYRRADDALALGARFRALNPARIAADLGAFPALAALDAPLDGTGTARLDGDGTWRDARLELGFGAGTLGVPGVLAERFGAPELAQTLPLREGSAVLHLDRAEGTLVVDRLELAFAKGASLLVPAPVDHRFPLSRIALRGRGALDGDRVEIEAFEADLDGPRLTASAGVQGLAGRPVVSLQAALEGLAVDALRRYWPPSLAPGGYAWCVESLSGGSLRRAELSLTAAGEGDGFTVERLEGTLAADGVTVDYLPPLPAVRDAAATARFDLSSFRVEIGRGSALGLAVTGGTVVIADFDKPVESIALDLAVAGPLADALDILGREPLGYTRDLGIDAAKARGRAEANIRLAFPLLRELPWEKVALTANVRLRGAAIDGIVAGQPIERGELDLRVDPAGLDLAGTLAVAGIPGRAVVSMNFADKAPFRTRVDFTASRFAAERLVRFAEPELALRPYLLGGDLAGTLRVVIAPDGTHDVVVRADLTQAEVALPPLGWRKARGKRGRASVELTARDQRLLRIRSFSAAADDLDIRGAAQFRADGGLQGLEIARLAHARTDLAGSLQRWADGTFDVTLRGGSLDVEPLLAAARADDAGGTATDLGALRLSATLDRVWFGADRQLIRVDGSAERDATGWSRLALTAALPDGSPIAATLRPQPPQRRELSIDAADAGRTLATLGAYTDMRGGRLSLRGTFDDARPASPLAARLRISDFNVVNAPLLARLLNLLALGGVVDVLRGDGISFSTLDAPFVLDGDRLSLDDAKAHGNTLGITASGTVDLAAETMDVQGTLVPFYLINAALGRIPLIGDLFTGGEAGGGLFAATYTMRGPLDDPAVAVNPLSILGPGMLRHLFSIFDPLWGSTRP